MSEINLVCNNKKCRIILNTYAWVTSCSHVFCDNHGSEIFNREKKCPCCNEVLNRHLDIVQTNLNPDESYKSVCNINHCIKNIPATIGTI
jgi:E3 ubiquitin-protein ligase CCNP1IP1